MPKVVSIRFHGAGKAYHFDPIEYDLQPGDAVIVETVHGVELGIVAEKITEIEEEKLAAPLKPVIRPATEEDLAHYEENCQKEKEAFQIALEKIAHRQLDMRLVDVEYTFDNRKIVFYFTADGRVDFRELVKDLAAIFRIRIELRQIGVRDEARKIGGIGICGRELCCCSFLNDFVPVSIKMAKEQSLSMNPVKISGVCGRLMCCLKYEQDAYEDAHARLPKVGRAVITPEGEGCVVNVNLLKETVLVKLNLDGENDLLSFPNEDIQVLTDGETGTKCPVAELQRAQQKNLQKLIAYPEEFQEKEQIKEKRKDSKSGGLQEAGSVHSNEGVKRAYSNDKEAEGGTEKKQPSKSVHKRKRRPPAQARKQRRIYPASTDKEPNKSRKTEGADKRQKSKQAKGSSGSRALVPTKQSEHKEEAQYKGETQKQYRRRPRRQSGRVDPDKRQSQMERPVERQ